MSKPDNKAFNETLKRMLGTPPKLHQPKEEKSPSKKLRATKPRAKALK